MITSGSTENIDLLRNGDAIIGLAQADIALMVYHGKGPLEEYGPFSELHTLGSLYPELAHVVVRQDRSIQRIEDLMGKKISLAPWVRWPNHHGTNSCRPRLARLIIKLSIRLSRPPYSNSTAAKLTRQRK